MKTFINKTFLAVVAVVLVAGTAFFTSCEKEENLFSQNVFEKSGIISIPRYSNYDEVVGIIDKVSTFDTLKELLDYEKTQGRRSIGAISDEFYENIDKENFSTQNDVTIFCNENSWVLDTFIKNNEVHIVPKYHQNSFRYVANQNGLFGIGNYVIRLFKNTMVATSDNNLDELLAITEADIELLDTAIFKVSKKLNSDLLQHNSCYYDDVYAGTVRNSDTKFEMELYLYSFWYPWNAGPTIYTKLEASNYNKFLGLWWSERYTTTINGSVSIHKKNFETDTWEIITKSIDVNKKIKSQDFTIYKDENTNRMHNSILNYHLKSFNISGRNLRVNNLTLQWN
jgi:hypothetical protein